MSGLDREYRRDEFGEVAFRGVKSHKEKNFSRERKATIYQLPSAQVLGERIRSESGAGCVTFY